MKIVNRYFNPREYYQSVEIFHKSTSRDTDIRNFMSKTIPKQIKPRVIPHFTCSIIKISENYIHK